MPMCLEKNKAGVATPSLKKPVKQVFDLHLDCNVLFAFVKYHGSGWCIVIKNDLSVDVFEKQR